MDRGVGGNADILYNLSTDLTKNTKNHIFFKALKKTNLVLFPGRILPCKQHCVHYTRLYTTNTHRGIKAYYRAHDRHRR